MQHPIRILVVSGDDPFRQAVRAMLDTAEDMVLVAETGDGRPDVALLDLDDLSLRIRQTMACLHAAYPGCKVIVFGDSAHQQLALDALREGAQGHLVKGAGLDSHISEAIRTVHRGGSVVSPGLAGWILDEISRQ